MLVALGLTDEDVMGTPEQRNRPQPLLGGKSARYAMSTLGTQWGRNLITPNIWANAAEVRVERHLDAPEVPVVTTSGFRTIGNGSTLEA
jgi:hypothetical protein